MIRTLFFCTILIIINKHSKLYINYSKKVNKKTYVADVQWFQVPGSPMEFHHNDSGIRYLDEGPMQSFVVSTQLKKNYDHVFISVWAVNKVIHTFDNSTDIAW